MINEEFITRWQAASVRTVDIDARLKSALPAHTLAHVRRVAELARTLADHLGANADQVELAALLHEIAARYSDRQLLRLAEYFEIPVNPTEARVPRLLHGKVGAEILRQEWGILDREVLAAVRNHVGGAAHMGLVEKIVFLADKLEPERDRFYGDLDPIRALAIEDPDAAVAQLTAWREANLPLTGTPDPRTDAAHTLTEYLLATR
jgi:predicted HD superfamily hydrolase involved in NAD metabolism